MKHMSMDGSFWKAVLRMASALMLLPIVGLAGVGAFGNAREPDISGIYLNRFSGGFSGTEWFAVIPVAGEPHKYRFADIVGGGFAGRVDGREIVLDNGVGTGVVDGADGFTLNPQLGGQRFTFISTRAPGTTNDFVPTGSIDPQQANPELAGNWVSTTNMLDPKSGAPLGGGEETLRLTVNGPVLTITDPQGLYFSGVFVRPDMLEIRVIEGEGSQPSRQPIFKTLPGSASNVPQDIFGRVHFAGTDSFTATVLMQSRTALGAQKQRVVTFVARRAKP
jgi:hypothetical protein